jgi:3-dehydroquinate dehydratase
MAEGTASGWLNASRLRRLAQCASLTCLAWLGGLALVAYEVWHLAYAVDWAASLGTAFLLVVVMAVLWQLHGTQVLQEERMSRKQWLKLLIVQRQEIETALLQLLATHTSVTQVISESDQPQLQQIWTDVVLHAHRLDAERLSSPLEAALSSQASLNAEMEQLAQQMLNLQIQFSQGAHQSQLVHRLHEVLASLKSLLVQSQSTWQSLSQARADQLAHRQATNIPADAQFEAWRHSMRLLQKQLRAVEQSLRSGLGETVAPTHSSPELMKWLEPGGPI